ncbi:MAG TPA: PEGA domain-containing protein [Rhodothermales bacterium]|nr:PEGA domain-containing protein [Rhodothermales bacterium]
MLRRIRQEHPTAQEFDPPQNWLIVDAPDRSDLPVWVEPPHNVLEDAVGRIRYFGFGILVVATLAALPLLLLLLPAGQHDDLDETELAELLAVGQNAPSVAPVNADGTRSPEITGSYLSVDTDPSGAVVFLDYDSVGTTPLRGHLLKPGVYVLSVRRERYAPLDTVVFVDQGGASSVVSISLHPASIEDVATRNEGSSVAAQRREAGRVQAERQRVRSDEEVAPAPERSARGADADLKNAPSLEDTAGANADSEHSKNTADGLAQAGKLIVLVKPWGSIYIDGILYKRNTDIQYTTMLPAGSHRIRVVHPELGARERDVQIRADQPVHIVFELLGEQ